MINLTFKRLRLYQNIKRFYFSSPQTRLSQKTKNIDLKGEFENILRENKSFENEGNKIKLEELKINMKQDLNNNKFNEASENTENNLNENESKNKESINNESQTSENIKLKSESEEKKSNYSFKKKNMNNSEEEKQNAFSKFINGFVKVWKQTFPGEQNYDEIHEIRKKQAQSLKAKIKEPKDEEIAELEAQIPEWKRGALVLISDQPESERESIFEQARKNLVVHVKNLSIYKESVDKYNNSEVKLLVKDLKESYSNVRENIKESQNPLFVVSRDLIDRVPFNSSSSLAISIMRKHDPLFDLVLFEKEVEYVFKQLMTAAINDDLDTVKLLSGESALAILTSEIRSRRERVSSIIKI